MTSFIDGPAKGQSLMLHRAARFLRVVETRRKWDALDQLHDKPAADEKIYVYEIAARPGFCHLHRSGGRGGFYPIAEYKFADTQPDDAVARDTEQWWEWTRQQAALNPS